MQALILDTMDAMLPYANRWPATDFTHPFAGWRAVRQWLVHSSTDVKPFVILVLNAQDQVVAVAPWCIMRSPRGLREVRGIGGEDAWYHDPCFIRKDTNEAASIQIADSLRTSRQEWDTLNLILRPELSRPLLRELKRIGWCVEEQVRWRQHPLIGFDEDWSEYWSCRPQPLLGLYEKRSRRLGKVSHRFLVADRQNAEELLVHLFRLHAEGLPAVRDWQPYHEYVRGIALDALEREELDLAALEIEGRIAAVQLRVRCGERAFALIRGQDKALDAYSPGTLLNIWSIERHLKMGVRWIDLGPGNFSWKEQLQTSVTETATIRVASPSSLTGLATVVCSGTIKPYLQRNPVVQSLRRQLLTPRNQASAPSDSPQA